MVESILKCDRCKKETPMFAKRISVERTRWSFTKSTDNVDLCEKCAAEFNAWLNDGSKYKEGE